MGKLKTDNPIFDAIGKIGDIFLLNLLWLLCAAPLITLGASTTALYSVARKIVAQEPTRIAADFFHAFRINWKQATALWLILAVLGAVAVIDLAAGLRTSGAVGNLFRGIGLVVLILWSGEATFSFSLLSRFEYRIFPLLRDAFLLSVKSVGTVLMSAFLLLWVPVLSLVSPAAFLFVLPIWIFLGGGVSALILCAMLRPVLQSPEGT